MEPLLEDIDLQSAAFNGADSLHSMEGIHWVIIGGESGGSKARPCNVEWIQNIIRQCKSARVPCFVKQVGSKSVGLNSRGWIISDAKGGDMTEWPESIKVREFPKV